MSENSDQGQSGGALREQLETALAEITTLKEQHAAVSRDLAFTKAGMDTENGVGKLVFKTYDGDLTPEAVTEYAKEYGIEVGSTSTQGESSNEAPQREQLDPAQQRMDSLRSQSRPAGEGQRMDVKQFLSLNQTDPGAARAAMEAGQVDVPPHMQAQLAANRGGA